MNKEWNNVEFKFGTSPEVAIDLCVTDFGSRMGLMDKLSHRKAAKEALTDVLKNLKKEDDEEESTKDPQKVTIHYEGKGGLTALVLNGEPSTFVLQTHLRKAFASLLKAEDKDQYVNFSIIGLKDSLAKQVLGSVASMAVLVRYKPELFGKKHKSQKKLGKLTLNIQTSLNKKQALEIIDEGRVLGYCNNQVRYLAELPSNILNPTSYYERIQSVAKELKVECNFFGCEGT